MQRLPWWPLPPVPLVTSRKTPDVLFQSAGRRWHRTGGNSPNSGAHFSFLFGCWEKRTWGRFDNGCHSVFEMTDLNETECLSNTEHMISNSFMWPRRERKSELNQSRYVTSLQYILRPAMGHNMCSNYYINTFTTCCDKCYSRFSSLFLQLLCLGSFQDNIGSILSPSIVIFLVRVSTWGRLNVIWCLWRPSWTWSLTDLILWLFLF